jgi:hypothetical protein
MKHLLALCPSLTWETGSRSEQFQIHQIHIYVDPDSQHRLIFLFYQLRLVEIQDTNCLCCVIYHTIGKQGTGRV